MEKFESGDSHPPMYDKECLVGREKRETHNKIWKVKYETKMKSRKVAGTQPLLKNIKSTNIMNELKTK